MKRGKMRGLANGMGRLFTQVISAFAAKVVGFAFRPVIPTSPRYAYPEPYKNGMTAIKRGRI